ncbi:nitrate ABC transporter substrate-binding protein [Gluconacetobacter tumulisoli]|uniref:Nitrate ABC transporter substrate-binding protein n=1 Tax=Gluconacetobacter tumulisoli TaxID=1286189 RepID=A0A7W4K9F2_9PROT|nr:nitrate ABC transporter substrate-binding protein [Gluconacetobacter tumulisoli]MBB2202783.1 nitrate ABC transporter substrate-binding protein [Gluconacetobacter tumulisoli]
MKPIIRLALRDWDYLTPILLDEVRSDVFDIRVTTVGTLLPSVDGQGEYDGAELSFSRYARECAAGRGTDHGVPYFLMRGFRHRCILTRKSSGLTTVADLAGKAIGVTGWPDSGNTWTRAILRREGISVADARWFAGRLTEAHPIVDRLSGFGQPGLIEAAPEERSLMSLLADGFLDAVFTPFLPPNFFDEESPFRHLLPDFKNAELSYYAETGYVPGMHILGLRRDIVAEYPDLETEISDLLDRSKCLWLTKRTKYADTTPWILNDFATIAQKMSPDWDSPGVVTNRPMIDDFCEELSAQGIIERDVSVEQLFPHR